MAGNKILIVEDDPDVVQSFTSNLKKRGYEVVSTSDGAEGLAKAMQEKPDLILVGVELPGMDGFTLVRRLKREPAAKGIPIIVLASNEPVKDLFLMEGVQDYFIKSVNPEGLFAAIEKNLSSRRPS